MSILNSLVIKARHQLSDSPKKSSLLFRHAFDTNNSAGFQASIESQYLSNDNNKTRLHFKTYEGGSTANVDTTRMSIMEDGKIEIYGILDMIGGKIINLGSPTNNQDGATKGYVDAGIGSITSSQWTTSGGNVYYTGNVGIGTNDPAGYKLNIKGTTDLVILQGNHATYEFKTTATTSGYKTTFDMNDTGLYIGHNSTSRAIIFNQDINERMRIHTNGYVGIGGHVPQYTLDVSGGMRVISAQATLHFQRTGETGSNGWVLGHTGLASNNFYIYGYNSGSGVGDITLHTQATERMRILGTNGHVGIGTNNPLELLHVNGTARIQKIIELDNPVNAKDAVNKQYVDGGIGTLDVSMGKVVFQENGVLLSDLSANGFKITSLGLPTDISDAATKGYVDGKIISSPQSLADTLIVGNKASTTIDMSNNSIIRVSTLGINTSIPRGVLDINQSYYNTIRILGDGNKKIDYDINIITVPDENRSYHANISYYWKDYNGEDDILRHGYGIVSFIKRAGHPIVNENEFYRVNWIIGGSSDGITYNFNGNNITNFTLRFPRLNDGDGSQEYVLMISTFIMYS